MATKHKHRTKQGANGLIQQAQRSLEKGDFRQALKLAKVCYRQEPSPESRQLLERAYLARGRQLHRAGLRKESQGVAESLLDLGVTDDSVQQELPELLIAVGLSHRTIAAGGGGPSLEEGDPLYVVAADHAVLRPEGAPASCPAIRQGAATIRRALAALEAGDEAQALACLKDIARASPFADWKYLVRGLAAYYREDAAQMQANWERLDPGRFAARIVAPLKALAGAAVADDPAMADQVARLGSGVLGGPILERLQRLQDLVVAGRCHEAVKLLRASRSLLSQVDPALQPRIAMVLYATFVRKGDPSTVDELAKVMDPPPIDPHHHRGLAMAWEHCEDGDLSDIERHWRAYLDDLAGLECLSPAERTLARALVWLRLGKILFEESRPICPTCGVCHEPDEAIERRAVACFENSLKSAPELLKAHQALAKALEAWEKPEQAAAAYRRLVERFPENLDGLLSLADHYVKRDKPLVARDFLFRAQRLKPLDPQIKSMVHAVHLASARHHALASRWEEGREALSAAQQMAGPRAEGHRVLAHRAVLEMKAGQPGLAQRLLDQARNELGEPVPVWLLATIESVRYALPKADRDEYEARWVTAMKRGRTSLAAGEACRIMAAYLEADVDYRGRTEHVEFLLDFLRRCSRIRWQARDLRGALEFLMYVVMAQDTAVKASSRHVGRRADPVGAMKLLATFATKARSKFPDDAYFQLLAGEMEMRKGPRKCKRRFARGCFERALEFAQRAGDPDGTAVAKSAKEKLLFLDQCDRDPRDVMPRLPFTATDDAPADPFDLSENMDPDDEDVLPRGMAGSLYEMFARVCREAGVEPEEILDEIDKGMPFRFRPNGRPKARRKNR